MLECFYVRWRASATTVQKVNVFVGMVSPTQVTYLLAMMYLDWEYFMLVYGKTMGCLSCDWWDRLVVSSSLQSSHSIHCLTLLKWISVFLFCLLMNFAPSMRLYLDRLLLVTLSLLLLWSVVDKLWSRKLLCMIHSISFIVLCLRRYLWRFFRD
jgi:hypothetical protein